MCGGMGVGWGWGDVGVGVGKAARWVGVCVCGGGCWIRGWKGKELCENLLLSS